MIELTVAGIEIYGPGLDGWEATRGVLRGERAWQNSDTPAPAPQALSAGVRRRTTKTTRLALALAQGALAEAEAPRAAVFASAAGDADITDCLCTALAQPDRPVSPTHFHNSVHNAPAGYQALAAASPSPTTSIAAGSASFAAGLLEAATQVLADRAPVLLVAYDRRGPDALARCSGIEISFGAALLLAPAGITGMRLRLDAPAPAAATVVEGALEALRLSNPAARALPLLQLLGTGSGEAVLPYLDGQGLKVQVSDAPDAG